MAKEPTASQRIAKELGVDVTQIKTLADHFGAPLEDYAETLNARDYGRAIARRADDIQTRGREAGIELRRKCLERNADGKGIRFAWQAKRKDGSGVSAWHGDECSPILELLEA